MDLQPDLLTEEHMNWFEPADGNVTIMVHVVPRASGDGLAGFMGDALKVRVQAPPADGRANERLLRFLSREWKIPRHSMEILAGQASRRKRIRISDPPAALLQHLKSMNPS
jgi:uncharacterized protein (TIGR00251 family)